MPPIRIFRRWIGLDDVPILTQLDKKDAAFERMIERHNETMEGLQSKLARLQKMTKNNI